MKNGKSRLQRVQVLASGKYKFVKNLGKRAKSKVRKVRKRARTRTRSNPSRSHKMGSKGILGNLGAVGIAEDAAIGFFGSSVLMGMGYPLDQALPMTRVVQGAAAKALNRRGKGRLAYGIIDLIDVYLIKKGFNLQGISLKAWM